MGNASQGSSYTFRDFCLILSIVVSVLALYKLMMYTESKLPYHPYCVILNSYTRPKRSAPVNQANHKRLSADLALFIH